METTNKTRTSRVIDIVQWVLISLLCVSLMVLVVRLKRANDSIVKYENTITEYSYKVIYDSQTIRDLKKENRELYDSIKKLKNVESAIEIRYKYVFLTDTIKVVEFIYTKDSVYKYDKDNDTIHTSIEIMAKDLSWCKVRNEVNGKFTIISQNDDGTITTTINHDPNMQVDGVTAWHAKEKWYKGFFIGPSIGFGYCPVNNKADMCIGVSAGYNLLFIKGKKKQK